MAYLDLRLGVGLNGGLAAGTAVPAPELAPRRLGRPERDAIALALSEGRTALLLGRVSRLLGRLWLGMNDEPVFAAERIEAIRRYAVRYRLEGGGLALAEDDRLRAAGVDEVDAAELRALVDGHAADAPKRRPGRLAAQLLGALLIAAIPMLGAAILYLWLAGQVEDRLSALVVSIILVVAIVSPAALAGHPSGRSA
ncbi:MAG TPA: hypothetical protein VGC56_12265 [Allosphingosinicella sp.]|jgi:hypothetical protein